MTTTGGTRQRSARSGAHQRCAIGAPMRRAVKKRRVKRREPEWGRAFMQRLVRGGVPRILLRVCATLLVALGPDTTRDLQALEFFSGFAAVTKALRKHGCRAYGYEIEDHADNQCDWLSSAGFVHAVCCAMRLEEGAFSINAPVCSTWSNMSRISRL